METRETIGAPKTVVDIRGGKTDKIHKIKLWDKVRALEMLAKYFGLLTEKVEHAGDIAFRWLEPSERS